MITHVRFQTPVVIGGVDCNEWFLAKPGSTALAGKIIARPGRPELGEGIESIVFECRIVKGDWYDVEVKASNIAHVIRSVEPQPASQPAKDKTK